MRFDPYLPHYYLGLAKFRTGDCRSALEAWDEAGAPEALASVPALAKDVDQGRKTCQEMRVRDEPGPDAGQVARAAVAVHLADAELERAEAASRSLGALLGDSLLADIGSTAPAFLAEAREAQAAVSGIRARLETATARSDLSQLREIRESAVRTRERLEAAREVAMAKRAEARVAAAASPAPASPGPARPRVSDGLVVAAQAVFDGEYRRAIDTLSGVEADGPAAAHVHLLRAAANHALFLIGGGKDARLLRSAAEDVRACRRLDSTLRPDPQVFSPLFTEMFDRTP
jgi:hypothetical protein